jgi:hypothetical protein
MYVQIGHGLLVYGGAGDGAIFNSAFLLENESLTEGARLASRVQTLEAECALRTERLAADLRLRLLMRAVRAP